MVLCPPITLLRLLKKTKFIVRCTLVSISLFFAELGLSKDFHTYRDLQDGYKIEYPSNWIVEDYINSDFFVSEPSSNRVAMLSTLYVSIDKSDLSLDDFCSKYFDEIKLNALFENVKFLDRQNLTKKNSALILKCSARVLQFDIIWFAKFVKKDEKVYSAFFTFESNRQLEYAQVVERIIKSFKIL